MIEETKKNTTDTPVDTSVTTPPEQNEPGFKNKSNSGQKNKKFVFIVIIGVLILIPLFVSSTNYFLVSSKPTPTPTIVPPTVAPIKELPTPTPNASKEASEITKQAKPQLDKLTRVDYKISRIKTYQNTWALMQITNPETDPANILLRKEGESWKILLGPQTYFSDEELSQVGVPEEIKSVINSAGF